MFTGTLFTSTRKSVIMAGNWPMADCYLNSVIDFLKTSHHKCEL